jgi:4-hydroxymandelate oxidase
MQLYVFRDREMTKDWLQRAKESGYEALCITLDSIWPPKRERNIRNDYQRTRSVNYASSGSGGSSREQGGRSQPGGGSPASTWKDLEWIKSLTDLPIVAKGIMTGDDAELCAQIGIDAVLVSNHGGRHLDNTLATIEVLPEVVDAVKGRAEILHDGGVMRGADVVKALALGAKAVFIGRPIYWGLAVNGHEGLIRVMEILREEMEITMVKCGRATIENIDSSVVVKAPPL